MTSKQFAHLSELVDDIAATDDPAITAIACRALSDILTIDLTSWHEEAGA